MKRTTFLWVTLGAIVALMVMGNLVSVMGAGLGCPDWPLCYGRLIPPPRWDAWVEFSHRLLGLGTTLLILHSAWTLFREGPRLSRRLLLGVLLLLLVQIPLGGVVVFLEIPVLVTSLHLVTAFTILGLFFLAVWVHARGSDRLVLADRMALVMLGILLLQVFLGGVVRHSGASLSCPEFPTCVGGAWFPPVMNHATGVHLTHRFLGYLLGLLALVLFRRRWARIFLGVVLLQIALGAWTVLSRVDLLVVSLHYLNAILMFLFLLHTAFRPREGQ